MELVLYSKTSKIISFVAVHQESPFKSLVGDTRNCALLSPLVGPLLRNTVFPRYMYVSSFIHVHRFSSVAAKLSAACCHVVVLVSENKVGNTTGQSWTVGQGQ